MLLRSSLTACTTTSSRPACPCTARLASRPTLKSSSSSPCPTSTPHHVRSQLNVLPFDQAWAPNVEYSTIAPNLFAASLFPYLGFLFHLTRSGLTPRVALGGFYFLLVFVFVTIPAGIYAKVEYGTSLANVDWLHGSAESLLTITNLLIVLGMRQGIQDEEEKKRAQLRQQAPEPSGQQPSSDTPPS